MLFMGGESMIRSGEDVHGFAEKLLGFKLSEEEED